ncbi:MAG: hypothetical protein Q8K75_03525 [Chlamydiales bacterium]|nr:hypothetical protein [Chlamydiales bacterium]
MALTNNDETIEQSGFSVLQCTSALIGLSICVLLLKTCSLPAQQKPLKLNAKPKCTKLDINTPFEAKGQPLGVYAYNRDASILIDIPPIGFENTGLEVMEAIYEQTGLCLVMYGDNSVGDDKILDLISTRTIKELFESEQFDTKNFAICMSLTSAKRFEQNFPGSLNNLPAFRRLHNTKRVR